MRKPAEHTAYNLIFKGSMSQCIAAIYQMTDTPWMRPIAGFPNVGCLWLVTGITTIDGTKAPLNG